MYDKKNETVIEKPVIVTDKQLTDNVKKDEDTASIIIAAYEETNKLLIVENSKLKKQKQEANEDISLLEKQNEWGTVQVAGALPVITTPPARVERMLVGTRSGPDLSKPTGCSPRRFNFATQESGPHDPRPLHARPPEAPGQWQYNSKRKFDLIQNPLKEPYCMWQGHCKEHCAGPEQYLTATNL